MIPESMIKVEDRLAEMFAYLPLMKGTSGGYFKPTFVYGDQKQLLDFLRQNSKGASKYPIIWLLYPFNERHTRSRVEYTNMELVLAVETNSVMLNDQRMKETYDKVLIPLFNNIKKCFSQANIVNTPDLYEVTKYPNYSESAEGKENETTYVWDALKITFAGAINSNCLKPIFIPSINPLN
jgi:hypothetical protein